ncbi:FprA family A-type flavoprotein [Peptoniphilus sp. GNH]|nr:metallo-beta-lactamase domain protein [Clostridiales bacterium KA00134]UHR03022.1 FprA family A-type flavoprotein [Peptoniphilus sp. GNH]
MYNIRKVAEDLYFVGGNDKRIELFENMFPIPDGVSYNSYLLMDEKTVLVDSVDWSIARDYIRKVEIVLDGRDLDYLLIHHMEPDHCGAIEEICIRYPNVQIISSEQAFQFMRQMGYHIPEDQLVIVKEGDTMSFGKHTLAFLEAPMVHWPEVLMSLDTYNGVLFSADGFGSFKSMDGKLFADEVDWERDWLDEARRYLTNIVGKYGPFIQDILRKAGPLLPKVKYICPLHGLVWRDNLGFFIEKYDKWSKYEPEEEGVLIVYASMYGNTANAAQELANNLVMKGVKKVEVYDVSKTDISYLIAKTFQYSHLVLASVTYNLGIYPKMKNFLHDLAALNVQNRTVGIIENGTWACTVGDKMEEFINENLKLFDVLSERVTINTSLNVANKNDMNSLEDSIVESMKNIRELKEKQAK